MRNIFLVLFLGSIAFIAFTGCSSGGMETAMIPNEPMDMVRSETSHHTWGLWQFIADPEAGTLDVVQLRAGNFHLNALPFLEPPPLLNLTLESLEFNGNVIETDIGLRHPFLGLTEFTGFDVCGVLITNGSITGFGDSDLLMTGEGDFRLLNPDGLSRWWNPAEFPNNGTIFGYIDGLLGAPDSYADYNSTINGYKYFCDDLSADDPLSAVVLENRGMFSAGQKNIRHYSIDMGEAGLIFNYVIDACWEYPPGDAPWTAPDDFVPEANRTEAWRADVMETNNTLWNDGMGGLGGDLSLSIDLYDWYNCEANSITVESPGNFSAVSSTTPVGGGEGYSTYVVDITGATPGPAGIDILVTAQCEAEGYQDFLEGKPVCAYFLHSAYVGSGAPIEVDPYYDGVYPSGTTGDPLPTEWWMEFNGSDHPGSSYEWDFSYDGVTFNVEGGGLTAAHKYDYEAAEDYPITYDVALRVNGTDIYIYPTVVARGVYIDGATGSSGGSGAMNDPLDTINNGVLEAVSEADDVDGSIIMVRGDDGAGGQLVYNERIDLTSTHAGLGLQGYSLDTDHYKIPAMRNFTPPYRVDGVTYWCECIYVDSADGVRVDGFEFDNIRGVNTPGGHWDEHVAVISFTDSNNVRVSHTYCHNMATGYDTKGWKPGYSIWLRNCDDAVVTNTLFCDFEVAGDWGSVYWLRADGGGNLFAANNTADNIYTSPHTQAWWDATACGVNLSITASAICTNNLITNFVGIYDSYYDNGGSWGFLGSGNSSPTAEYCDVWNMLLDTYPPGPPYNPGGYRFFGDITEGTGCLDTDPDYIDGHHLNSGSPCIDTGDPGILDHDGGPSDMGCYGGPGGNWNFED